MNIGEYSIEKKVVSWLLVIIMVAGGFYGFEKMGKLEDPNFTIKQAKIITFYPGATAQEVQDEVTYHIEEALQLMGQLKRIRMSIARPGMSDLNVEFKDEYKAKDFPDIYDELRRKIADMKHKLPPGVQGPIIIDDFGDVYGIYLALQGEGYTYRDLKDVADDLKKQLVLVDGVKKIVIGGEQPEVVYVEISRTRMGELGISLEQIGNVLQSQNVVEDAGKVRVGPDYIRIHPTGEFDSVQAIGDLLISSENRKLIYLKDIASIHRAYEEVPGKLIYFNGKPALTMGISMRGGENVVAVGETLVQRFHELQSIIPVGMDLNIIYDQPTEVNNSVNGFIVSVGQAIGIVIAVLLLFMGLTSGLIIGAVLLITVAGTLLVMELYGIELQRISLGALVIALGMLVDNAIVVAEGMLVRIQSGMPATQAAKEAVGKTIWALLGGTIIGILAFSAIGLSSDNTGEFASSLFYVILISLTLSWVTAISTTPLLCALFMRPKKGGDGAADNPYDKGFFKLFRTLLKAVIKARWLAVIVVISLFVSAVLGFGYIKNAFFPSANTPMFFVDVWEPEGTDIRETRDDALKIAEFLRSQAGVVKTTTLVGGGDARFALTYEPKEASPAYAQIIVQTEELEQISRVWPDVEAYMRDNFPQLDPIIKPFRIGPGRDGKIEARFHGPDAAVLRDLAEQAKAIMRQDAEAKEINDDWRQPVELIRPLFNEKVGRQLGITRHDLAIALKSAFEGKNVGVYRDGIRMLPIKLRPPVDERADVANIQDIQVWSPALQKAVPVAQVVSGFETVFENTVIRGRNRIQTIIAACNPTGELATPLFNRLRTKIEAVELPPGYELSWGGEYEDSSNAQAGLSKVLPTGFIMMILVSILLFAKVRQPLIIWLTVPLAIVGITAGLLGFDGAFDFMSLLGALSLIGLLIKNAIVLIDEIDQQIDDGKEHLAAILDATVSRLRPVLMAAATTILGLIPLLSDVFFVNMSITIMAGLGFATLLTLLFVPVLYAVFFRVPYSKDA
ncbi:MAG: efflux RND transporter permease subunit [gamma proteobacterium endosymbiont of Lamellibrachia anaximandri]|nr:efflux RND transporter permease subunit [gamma proteobacterium endosymbiont of Lamellibrachia anaximandri]MBL3533403.1 efflux RND transporter permease subunit [gamma proteobacterium endosymbiont of Lamellibrachia anaximandri]